MLFIGLAVTVARTNVSLVLTQMVYVPNANTSANTNNNNSSGHHLICPVKDLTPVDDNGTTNVVINKSYTCLSINFLVFKNIFLDWRRWSLPLVAIHAGINFVRILLGIFVFGNSRWSSGAKIRRKKGFIAWHIFVDGCYVYYTDGYKIWLVTLTFDFN